MRTTRRLLGLAGMPRGRMALALVLGALAVGFGVALMTAAGYLISRAAEQPPILALTTTIVVVRFLALARPLARYLERLASHDLALRALGRIRSTVYREIEPLAPGELDAYRRGDLVNRLVADVDALQGLYVRGIGPPLVALVVSTACVVATAVVLPAAAVVLALGLALGGVAVPLLAARLSRFVGRRQAVARGELAAELAEILRGAPELAAYGREDDAFGRVASADAELRRLSRRDAFVSGVADAALVLVSGLTLVGVLALAVAAHDDRDARPRARGDAGVARPVLVRCGGATPGRRTRASVDPRVRRARARAHRPHAGDHGPSDSSAGLERAGRGRARGRDRTLRRRAGSSSTA